MAGASNISRYRVFSHFDGYVPTAMGMCTDFSPIFSLLFSYYSGACHNYYFIPAFRKWFFIGYWILNGAEFLFWPFFYAHTFRGGWLSGKNK
jgi:hypothetical protein